MTGKPTKDDLIKEKFSHLIGSRITITEASQRYDVHRDTLLEWKNKGYLRVLKPGYRMEVDEADVAYCADIYHKRKKSGIGFRAPLLDDDGLPYQLKHPKLSKYRRRKKKKS